MPNLTISPATFKAVCIALVGAKARAIADGNAAIDNGDFAAAADYFLAANGFIVSHDAVLRANDGSDVVVQRDNAMRALRQAHGALRASNAALRVVRAAGVRSDVYELVTAALNLPADDAERVYLSGLDYVFTPAQVELFASGVLASRRNGTAVADITGPMMPAERLTETTIADVCGPALDDRNLG